MQRGWRRIVIAAVVVGVVIGVGGVIVETTRADGWQPRPVPLVDGERIVGFDNVEEETARIELTSDGDGIVVVTVRASGPVTADRVRANLTSRLLVRYGDEAAERATVTVDGRRVQAQYRMPDVARPGFGETTILDVLYPADSPRSLALTVDRVTIESPARTQTVGTAADSEGTIVVTGDGEGSDPRIEPQLVAFAPEGPLGTLSGHVALYQYRATTSVDSHLGVVFWPLTIVAIALGLVSTGPSIEAAPRAMKRFEAGYIGAIVLGLIALGLVFTDPDWGRFGASPFGRAVALAPVALAVEWWLVGSDRGPRLDPIALVRGGAALAVGVIVAAPLFAGGGPPVTGGYRLLAALVPILGALPIVVGRGRNRVILIWALFATPVAVAIAASPLATVEASVFWVYAIVVGVCLIVAAAVDRWRLLDRSRPNVEANPPLTPDT